MNFHLASIILRGVWAIDPDYAQSHLPILMTFLKGDALYFEQPQAFHITMHESEQGNVAVIPIKNVLMKNDTMSHTGTASIGQEIKNAAQNPNIAGIVLDIDSPGGQVEGSQQLHDIIKNVSKPVVAFGNGQMSSAAYWIGSAADQIIAGSETAMIGSVGAMMTLTDLRGAKQFKGVKFHEVYASKSTEKNKEIRDLLEDNPKTIQKNLLDPMNEVFHSAVENNRPLASEEVFTGKSFLAKRALKNGLVDSIGTLEEAINSVHTLQNTVNMFDNKLSKKLKALKDKENPTQEEIDAVNKELEDMGISGTFTAKPEAKVDDVVIIPEAKAAATITVKEKTEEADEPATLESISKSVTALAEGVDAKFTDLDAELTALKAGKASTGKPSEVIQDDLNVIDADGNFKPSPMNARMKKIDEKYQKSKVA